MDAIEDYNEITNRMEKSELRILTTMNERRATRPPNSIEITKNDSKKFCKFHNSTTHNTDECIRKDKKPR